MAKRFGFPVRARKTPGRAKVRARKPISTGTFIQRSRAESSEQKAIWNDPRRRFFGLSTDEAAQCRDLLVKELDQRIAMVAR